MCRALVYTDVHVSNVPNSLAAVGGSFTLNKAWCFRAAFWKDVVLFREALVLIRRVAQPRDLTEDTADAVGIVDHGSPCLLHETGMGVRHAFPTRCVQPPLDRGG